MIAGIMTGSLEGKMWIDFEIILKYSFLYSVVIAVPKPISF